MKLIKKNQLLGAHMSIAGGPVNALKAGESIDCTAIQIFTASNRQWSNQLIAEKDVAAFLEHKKKSPIQYVVSHASYLINLGSPNPDLAHKSYDALKAELMRCNQLEIPYVVIHPGSSVNSTEEQSLELIAQAINKVLHEVPGCGILLENSAGQGSSLCATFEQLAWIHKRIHAHSRIGICFDTCHAFAAGYDFTTEDGYKKMWQHFDATIGLEHLKVMHMNDSEKACNCHVDRHTAIGKGKIGSDAFCFIMNDTALVDIPKILETPKEKDLHEDVLNLETLRSLIK